MSSEVNYDLAPAGWYPDPLGMDQVRWWNGFGWSNNIEQRCPELSVSNALQGSPGRFPRLTGTSPGSCPPSFHRCDRRCSCAQ